MKPKTAKRIAVFFAALPALAALVSCAGGEVPSPTSEPTVTQAPPVTYEITHIVRYWPEDADYDSCDYACVAEIPMFSREFTAGYAINKAVDAYYNKLCERIEAEYMPASVAEPPYTEVFCTVEYARRFTNVIFSEKHSYEAQPYTETHVLMLNERGEEANLCDLFLNYHADKLIAQRLSERISGDPRYSEADPDRILTFLDISHGAKITDEGCTVFIPEGKLADHDEGELSFDFAISEIAPEFVGENKAMTLEQYRSLTEFLAFVTDGLIVRTEDIENGVLSEFAASSFMGELASTLEILPHAGRIAVPEDRFLGLYRACFGTEFPGVDTDGHDILLSDGFYNVRSTAKSYRYNIDMLEASREGDSLTIDGDVIFGYFGFASTQFVCHARIALHENAESPYGFTLDSFKLYL